MLLHAIVEHVSALDRGKYLCIGDGDTHQGNGRCLQNDGQCTPGMHGEGRCGEDSERLSEQTYDVCVRPRSLFCRSWPHRYVMEGFPLL